MEIGVIGKKLSIGLLLLSLNLSVSASVESELKAERFQRTNSILIDNFSGLSWQDNKHARTNKLSYGRAKAYCSNLVLGNRKDWRLPTAAELLYAYKIKHRFNNLETRRTSWIYPGYRSSTKESKSSSHLIVAFYSGGGHIEKDGDSFARYVRCVSGKKINNYSNFNAVINTNKRQLKKQKSNKLIKVLRDKNTIKDYENFVIKYPNVDNMDKIKNYLNNLYSDEFKLAIAEDTIKSYHQFTQAYGKSPQAKEAIGNIFNLIKEKNNISGYEWFVSNYPNAKQVRESIQIMHRLAYKKSKSINTISSYNTFIISYPYASQIKEAVEKSSALESKKYDAIKHDDERKARLLAVKIKKMAITSNKALDKSGYIIIIERMSQLLTSKYESTDASLRYYESKEFTDFTLKFENTMSDIEKILNKINNNTIDLTRYASKMIEVVNDGFKSAKVDRDMATYKLEEHKKWEKFMHFRDSGYN